jgi:RNA polymerase subunit RPABC4/transcription elongation factor Spt4
MIVLLAYMLLIVYVSLDARRRQMHVLLWTLLGTFIPYGIGFILFFLLRRPLPRPCPQCQELVLADYVVCPACGHKLVQQCPGCHRKVERGWLNCAYCGTKLG